MLAYGYDVMMLHRLAADVDIDNLRSIALLERLGFQFEGVRRGCDAKYGAYIDLLVYQRLVTVPVPTDPPSHS